MNYVTYSRIEHKLSCVYTNVTDQGIDHYLRHPQPQSQKPESDVLEKLIRPVHLLHLSAKGK